MMRRMVDGCHEGGVESIAVLTASEPVIYGRFGYGLSTQSLRWSVPRGPRNLKAVAGSDGNRMRLVDPRAAYERCQALYDAQVPTRPGMLAREGGWHASALFDHESQRGGCRPMLRVIAEGPDGTLVAYARYAVREDYSTRGRPGCKVNVREVRARDAASYAAIWRFLLDLDLTDEVMSPSMPLDDPIIHLLNDARAAQPVLADGLYTRLVDVDEALAVRRYSVPVDMVFEVADAFCPWNAGRWRLTGDADGAVCAKTGDPADILIGVRELGSAYLGGFTLGALHRASLIEELRPGAVTAASLAFASDPVPWLPFGF